MAMTKTDYILVGTAVSNLPLSQRIGVYHRLCHSLGSRNPEFDPYQFGQSMRIPPLFRRDKKKEEV